MRVLIVKISALGDVVHALPVLAYIKSAYPETKIDWLVEEGFAPLIEGHPDLRRVHRLGLKRWRREGFRSVWAGVKSTLKELRNERYDVVLDLQGNCKSGLFTLLCGAPRRFGFSAAGVREWPNLLATNYKASITAADYHVSDQVLAVAKEAFPLGKIHPLIGTLAVSTGARAKVMKQLTDLDYDCQPLVVLQYGTTWETKFWPIEFWENLVIRLSSEDGLRPLLIWGNDAEYEVCQTLSRVSDGRSVIWPRGTLAELSALLERADVVVGGDTGPVHIAAAAGTATVSLYRSSDGNRSGPRGKNHTILQSPMLCSPCFKRECNKNEECSRSISVDTVLEAIRHQLKGDFA